MKCPKCGHGKGRETINRRAKQRLWICGKCGKLVILGKIDGNESGGAGSKTGAAAQKKNKAGESGKRGHKAAASSSSGKRRANGRTRKEPVQSGGGVQSPPKRERGSIERFIRDVFDLD